MSQNTNQLTDLVATALQHRPANFNRYITCHFGEYNEGEFVSGPTWFNQDRFLETFNMKIIDCDTHIHHSKKIIIYSDDIYNDCIIKSSIDFINIILSKHPNSKIDIHDSKQKSFTIQII